MDRNRYLIVIADDYGMGPATSRAILELGCEGRITGTVLLVNSPYAEDAVRAWRDAGEPMEMGWHPNLTLDRPLMPAGAISSLVGPNGCFWPLGRFLSNWALGRLRAAEAAAELRAQYERFVELTGRPPGVINSHQHVQLFAPIGDALLDVIRNQRPRPYVRRVVEPLRMLARIPGARIKRTCLTLLGRRHARRQHSLGFPGNEWLAGITDPPWVADSNFLVRWLACVPGRVVELACHPGYRDETLIGRDCEANDGLLQRRVCELELLRHASFEAACRAAGFVRVAPGTFVNSMSHAAAA